MPGSAVRAQASPRIASVLMSNLKHSHHATWTVPSDVVAGAAGDHAIRITAKANGVGAGAAGNGWTMVFDRASTHSAAKPLDIDVLLTDVLAAAAAVRTRPSAATTAPVRSIRYEFATARVSNLPMARDLVETAAGTGGGTEVTGPPLIPAFPAVAAVATGYAADSNTGADSTGAQDKVDENFNGSSQVRIGMSSSVKAPS